MSLPLVSIIVVSHNHGDFVTEAIESALSQTYGNKEVLVVDDGSTDHTPKVIAGLLEQGMPIKTLMLNENIGYCRAFNQAFSKSKGNYVVDLAADDVLLPERLTAGVKALLKSGAGVDFCDAYYINRQSEITGTHYHRNAQGVLKTPVKAGDVFAEVLQRYYICTPSMLIRRDVLTRLGGYDEELYYEDFDFWVRSSRFYQYHFTDRILVKKRVLDKSMSKGQYLPGSKMLSSTLKVCRKAYSLCQTANDFKALAVRLRYEIRQSIIVGNYQVASGLNQLLQQVKQKSPEPYLWSLIIFLKPNLRFLTRYIGKAR